MHQLHELANRLFSRTARATLTLCLLLAARTGQAQEPATALAAVDPPSAATAVELQPLVVTGRRVGQPWLEVDRSLHRLGQRRLTVLQPQSAPEALQETAGVHVQTSNRGSGAPYLRGLVGPQNLILVDGIRFNNTTFRTGPNQYLSLLDPSQIDSMEVLLGPGSVLYGSDAMGGVVQILPSGWREENGTSLRAGLRGATADQAGASWGEAGYHNDNLAVLGGGAYRQFGSLRTGGGAIAPVSDYRQAAGHLRARWRPASSLEITGNWLGGRIRGAGRADQMNQGRIKFYDNDSDLGWLDLRWAGKGNVRQVRLTGFLHRTSEAVDQFRCKMDNTSAATTRSSADACVAASSGARDGGHDSLPTAPAQRHEITSDDVLTPGAFATAQFDGWQGKVRGLAGADVAVDRVASTKEERRGDKTPAWTWTPAARGNFSDGSQFTTLGAFTHLDADLWRRGDQRLIVSGGGRLSRVSAHATAVPGVGDVAYDHLGLVGSAGVRWQAGATWMTYANFSQGFRAPNLQETTVLGNTGSKFEVPNADLRPEASHSYEAGARIDHRGFNLHAAAFVSLLRDAIDERVVTKSEFAAFGIEAADVGCKDLADPACKPLPVIQRVNAERGTLYGGELTVQGPAMLGMRPWLNASLIRGELLNAASTVTPARRIPPPMGAAGLRYEQRGRGWSAEVYSKFSLAQTRLHPSDEDDLRICENPAKPGTTDKAAGLTCSGTPGWATANLRGGYRWEAVRLDVALTNLLDLRYRYHGSGVDAPGFGGTATLTAEY